MVPRIALLSTSDTDLISARGSGADYFVATPARSCHTKFGAVSFCRFADVTEFEAIVTDGGLPASEAHRYSLLGPEVIRV